MPDYAISIVDAFTRVRYAGNSCAVITRAEGLDDAQMQAIAREMNLSETAFVTPSDSATFRVRFFTPGKEIPLAGHPTIATMFALAEEGRIDLSSGQAHVTQEIGAGILPVDLAREADGSVRVTMTQARPTFGAHLPGPALTAALRLSPADLREDLPAQVVSTGTPQAMLALRNLDALRRASPDYEALAALEDTHGFFGLHAFTLDPIDRTNSTHARHFSAGGGFGEDPVTGSASGGMGAFLWRYGLIREPFIAEQGHLMNRPGFVHVEVWGNGDIPEVARVSGHAITVLRGTITA